jgi:hypothetical protein
MEVFWWRPSYQNNGPSPSETLRIAPKRSDGHNADHLIVIADDRYWKMREPEKLIILNLSLNLNGSCVLLRALNNELISMRHDQSRTAFDCLSDEVNRRGPSIMPERAAISTFSQKSNVEYISHKYSWLCSEQDQILSEGSPCASDEWTMTFHAIRSSDAKIVPNYRFDPAQFIMFINSPPVNSASRSQLADWRGHSVVNIPLWRNHVVFILPSRLTQKQKYISSPGYLHYCTGESGKAISVGRMD